jgi:hypothetical protein
MLVGQWMDLYRVNKLVIHTTEYKPLGGSSYVDLPKFIKDKKAVINIKNTDQECFKWSVTRALNKADTHPERITKLLKQQAQQLRWDGY